MTEIMPSRPRLTLLFGLLWITSSQAPVYAQAASSTAAQNPAPATRSYVDPPPVSAASLNPRHWQNPKAVHIVLVGDSTVEDDAGWGTGFVGRIKPNAEGLNLAMGSRSTRTYREEGRWAQVLSLKPDFILYGFSHNDAFQAKPARYVTVPDFHKNLEQAVDEARANGSKIILMTEEANRLWNAQGKVDEEVAGHMKEYEDTTRAVAREKNVPLLDVEELSRAYFDSIGKEKLDAISLVHDGKIDQIHFKTGAGAALGAYLADAAKKQIPELAPYLQ